MKHYIQAFKNITVKMKLPTNSGMTDITHKGSGCKDIESVRLNGSKLYFPVKLNADGLGELASASTDVVIGVVTETFSQPMAQTQIMVQGIVPMKTTEALNGGELVGPGDTEGSITKATTGKSFFGICMDNAKAGDYVSVLIGTTGGVVK